MTDCVYICVILQAMDREVLKVMKQTLAENKTLEKLTLSNDNDVFLPKEFCRQVVFERYSVCTCIDREALNALLRSLCVHINCPFPPPTAAH